MIIIHIYYTTDVFKHYSPMVAMNHAAVVLTCRWLLLNVEGGDMQISGLLTWVGASASTTSTSVNLRSHVSYFLLVIPLLFYQLV